MSIRDVGRKDPARCHCDGRGCGEPRHHLDEAHEAAEQIAFADIILLNKVDLVDAAALATAEARSSRSIPMPKIVRLRNAAWRWIQVLGLDAFSLERVLEIKPDFLDESHTHEHEEDITSVFAVLRHTTGREEIPGPGSASCLRERGQEYLPLQGHPGLCGGRMSVFVVHAVHMLTEWLALGALACGQAARIEVGVHRARLGQMGLAEGFAACKAA